MSLPSRYFRTEGDSRAKLSRLRSRVRAPSAPPLSPITSVGSEGPLPGGPSAQADGAGNGAGKARLRARRRSLSTPAEYLGRSSPRLVRGGNHGRSRLHLGPEPGSPPQHQDRDARPLAVGIPPRPPAGPTGMGHLQRDRRPLPDQGGRGLPRPLPRAATPAYPAAIREVRP